MSETRKVRQTASPPLRDQACTILKVAILSREFASGDCPIELEIANTLDLGRSPVREAFHRLEQKGSRQVTRAGVTIQPLSSKDIQGISLSDNQFSRTPQDILETFARLA